MRRQVREVARGRVIREVQLRPSRLVRRHDPEEVRRELAGRRIGEVGRRGKVMLLELEGGPVATVHFGLTGRMVYQPPGKPSPFDRHAHVVLQLDEGVLGVRDVRQLGELELIPAGQVEQHLGLGPEPLSQQFTPEALAGALRTNAKLKAALMNQHRIAGIGNIYSDEILWEAGLHPLRPARSLSLEELERLHRAIQDVLQEAIERGGSSAADFLDIYGRPGQMTQLHRVYRQHGKPCSRCGTTIERVEVGGRGCHFCPSCQR